MVVDTNVLLQDVLRTVRTGRPTCLQQLATLGAIRVFAADHVHEEVLEHLPRRADQLGLGTGAALDVWRGDYLPTISWVNVGGVPATNELLAQIAARDADDVGTATLALLLGTKALSEDNDLVAFEVATGLAWLGPLLAVRTQSSNEMLGMLSVELALAGIEGLAYALKQIDRRFGVALVLLLALGSIPFALRPTLAHKVDDRLQLGRKVTDITTGIWAFVESRVDEYSSASAIAEVLHLPRGELTLLQMAGRRLATSFEPIGAAALLDELGPSIELPSLESALTLSGAFVKTPQGWQLGRTAQS
ncbi:MAG: hypothetical protein CVU47_01180 [Chloroflexi bacterium HGW-Chloroflexi-9]|nr:MAG: hypothetical protein CVU47_01180 [Chloroflexi bacterium HGW-Chloroflexi-9]